MDFPIRNLPHHLLYVMNIILQTITLWVSTNRKLMVRNVEHKCSRTYGVRVRLNWSITSRVSTWSFTTCFNRLYRSALWMTDLISSIRMTSFLYLNEIWTQTVWKYNMRTNDCVAVQSLITAVRIYKMAIVFKCFLKKETKIKAFVYFLNLVCCMRKV